ncbi:hypothetical protein N9N28_12440 [Rubripirellula amarantea]|nr:hypothetical protein [Rubripirellula amarantea]
MSPIHLASLARAAVCNPSVYLGRSLLVLALVVVPVIARHATIAAAESFSVSDPLITKLSSPTTAIVDGRGFRSGVQSVAQAAGVNVWIDRNVDPDRIIAAGKLGPTVYDALAKLAEQNGCRVLVAPNMVVLGRAAWLDQVASMIEQSPKGTSSRSTNDIVWPDLTTPSEALAIVRSVSREKSRQESPTESYQKSPEQLPHDLWPEVSWKDVRFPIAETLVRAQFVDANEGPVRSLSHRYVGLSLETAKEAIASASDSESASDSGLASGSGLASDSGNGPTNEADARTRVRKRGRDIEVLGNAEVHRALMAALVMRAKRDRPAGSTEATFTLTTRARASDILVKLASAGGIVCTIELSAIDVCDQQVTLEAKDATIEELVRMITDQVGASVTFSELGFVVTQ